MTRAIAKLAAPIRLDLNTAPFLNEAAIRAALESTDPAVLAQYPDPDAPLLTEALASRLKVPKEAILVGNGSDEILDLAVRVSVPRGRPVAVLLPSFSMYDHVARSNGVDLIRIPATDVLPIDALASSRAEALLLASPNNPTGAAFPREAFETLVDRVRAPVVIDEAYAEFARQDLRSLAASSDRVLVMRTFSKAFGLPGVRVGYAVGPPALLAKMRAIKMPYNVSTFGERAALAALAEPTFAERVVALVDAERPRVFEALKADGWPVWPSRANFLLVGPLRNAAGIQSGLSERGILVKLIEFPGGAAGPSLRITIGTREQNDVLAEAMREVGPRPS